MTGSKRLYSEGVWTGSLQLVSSVSEEINPTVTAVTPKTRSGFS